MTAGGDDARARRRQGDQAGNYLRSNQSRGHTFRGAEARLGNRDVETQIELQRQSGLDEVAARERLAHIDQASRDALRQLDSDREFLRHCNVGGEVMSLEARERVNRIGTGYKWIDVSGGTAHFLTQDEIRNLTIARGTLTNEET